MRFEMGFLTDDWACTLRTLILGISNEHFDTLKDTDVSLVLSI
jgi:hypothetical protein